VSNSPEELDPHLVLSEKNAEIRREIVRKIGIDRIYQSLGGIVIDSLGLYDLVNLQLGDGRNRPYLKMINPSIGTTHLEGVAPGITTVEQALAWRNSLKEWEEPVVLT
jgi:hypothetical protein